jgi:hypothetical protein
VGKCTKTGVFSSDIGTFTPLADELWSKTVAGNSSFFRRIFPKIGENSPFAKIKDIPAVSKVDYVVTPGKNSQGVTGEAGLTTQDPELYFPHFGGMYDYFLLAVQSMLRPKGFPGQPAGLQPDQPITEVDRVNEYLSWYLNGTLFRAEGDPLSDDDPEDIKRLIDLSGPLNKLLPQWIQWRNKVDSDVLTSQRPERQRTGRVDEVQRQKEQKEDKRHNQIVACTFGLKIPGWIPIFGGQEILAFPIACSEKELASIGQVPSGISPTPTPPPGTGDCPRSSIPNMPVNSSCKLSWNKIGSADIPPLMKKVFEAAGAKYNVPPDLIAGIMFAEGGFEPRIFEQNCYVDPDANYTDKNIENAILCEFKNCDPNDYHSPCNYNSNQGAFCAPTGAYGPYQQCPNNYNPCNFYDATMNAAEKLSRDRFGMPIQYFKDRKETPSCLGVSYNLGSTSTGYSCSENSWSCRDVITAIRFEAGSCIPGHFTNVLNILGKCP